LFSRHGKSLTTNGQRNQEEEKWENIEHRTLNAERRTPNIEWHGPAAFDSTFDVQCSVFDVLPLPPHRAFQMAITAVRCRPFPARFRVRSSPSFKMAGMLTENVLKSQTSNARTFQISSEL
jgi:hypothetical protein